MSFLHLFSLYGRTKHYIFVRIYILSGILSFLFFILANIQPYKVIGNAIAAASSLVAIYVVVASAIRRLHDMDMSGWNILWLSIPFVIESTMDLHGFAKIAMIIVQMIVFVFLGITKSKEPNRF